MSPPFSELLRLLGFYSCVTVESLLTILSIEGYYVGLRNTIFCDAFTAVLITDALWDFVP
jgi:hypothetical protein